MKILILYKRWAKEFWKFTMAPHQGKDLLPKVIKANNQTVPREKEQGIDQNKIVDSQTVEECVKYTVMQWSAI